MPVLQLHLGQTECLHLSVSEMDHLNTRVWKSLPYSQYERRRSDILTFIASPVPSLNATQRSLPVGSYQSRRSAV